MIDWIGNWPGALWLQGSSTAYLLVNAAHILGLALLLGGMLPLDLKLVLGRATSGASLAVLAPFAIRTAAKGLALAVLTGALLFSVDPQGYLDNPAFRWKLLLLALALANVAVQHRQWPVDRTGAAMLPVAAPVRIVAGVSALLWLSVLVAGRWIGFV